MGDRAHEVDERADEVLRSGGAAVVIDRHLPDRGLGESSDEGVLARRRDDVGGGNPKLPV